MKKKTGFTFEQHWECGAALQRCHRELHTWSTKISNAYGKTHKVSENMEKSVKLLEKVKAKLDDLVGPENPDLDESKVNHCYYDATQTRRYEDSS